MKIRFFFIVLVLFLSCNEEKTSKLTIATSANMQFVIQGLVDEFQNNNNIACEIVLGSSGKLTAQIKEGAPFDIFLSANLKYPNSLFLEGVTDKKPLVYAYGSLVIWTMNSQLEPAFGSILLKHIKHIAIGNPKTAPYGLAAKEVLVNKGIFNKIKSKLVFGESVIQTNQFIISYSAQIGITSKSSVMFNGSKEKGKWKEIDKSLYQPIKQGVILLNNREQNKVYGQKFIDFLFSKKGKEILNKYGYITKI